MDGDRGGLPRAPRGDRGDRGEHGEPPPAVWATSLRARPCLASSTSAITRACVSSSESHVRKSSSIFSLLTGVSDAEALGPLGVVAPPRAAMMRSFVAGAAN